MIGPQAPIHTPVSLKRFFVNFDQFVYDIVIGRDVSNEICDFLPRRTENKKVIFVVDDCFQGNAIEPILEGLRKKDFEVHVYAFTAGKVNKTIEEALKIFKVLESEGFARDSTLVAVGGGVIGDLAGFVASTFYRGMNLIHVPTTLTAMVDSSIGGKVAINFHKTINAIGNYYHPILNVVDLKFLDTLPDIDFRSGMAEVIKCAIIDDAEFFQYLESHVEKAQAGDLDTLMHLITRTIEIKIDHVKSDIREANKRLKLNYGHTVGHAIEASTGSPVEIYRHGEGVSLGMVGEAHIARHHLKHDDSVILSHERVLRAYGLPVRINTQDIGIDPDKLMTDMLDNIWKDKKRISNKLRFVLADEIGTSSIHSGVTNEEIQEAFHYLLE